jgi:hypothetical protein
VTDMFDDWRYRASRLCKNGGRWHVLIRHEPRDGWPGGYPILRRVRKWSPRDWVRFPLFTWWKRHYW